MEPSSARLTAPDRFPYRHDVRPVTAAQHRRKAARLRICFPGPPFKIKPASLGFDFGFLRCLI